MALPISWPEFWTLLGGGTNNDLRDMRKLVSGIYSTPNVGWSDRMGFRCVGDR